MSEHRDYFLRHLAQTSDAPIGLEIVRAEGSWLYDSSGRRFLDLISGIGVANLGHGHPAILAALEAQARRHLHVMVYGEYVLESQALLARRLAELLPERLQTVYFTNSGAESIEGALKLARKFTSRSTFVAFEGAYHGDTMAALALMGNEMFRAPFEPLPGPVRRLPYAENAALSQIDSRVAAVVVEPVQAEGGVRIPSGEFLHELRRRCDDSGALLIFDEVLTGFGRIGSLFAFQHFEVEPDVLVLAKALGGGLPLGAFCSSRDIMAVLARNPPLGHITTFGGHPLSCATAVAFLDTLCSERLWKRAKRVGADLLARLRKFKGRSLVAVRGIGLLIGLEFATPDLARRFVAAMIERGVVVNWTLNADHVVRIAPPLTIASDEIDFAVEAVAAALGHVNSGGTRDIRH